jgi:hypothetical protein
LVYLDNDTIKILFTYDPDTEKIIVADRIYMLLVILVYTGILDKIMPLIKQLSIDHQNDTEKLEIIALIIKKLDKYFDKFENQSQAICSQRPIVTPSEVFIDLQQQQEQLK